MATRARLPGGPQHVLALELLCSNLMFARGGAVLVPWGDELCQAGGTRGALSLEPRASRSSGLAVTPAGGSPQGFFVLSPLDGTSGKAAQPPLCKGVP